MRNPIVTGNHLNGSRLASRMTHDNGHDPGVWPNAFDKLTNCRRLIKIILLRLPTIYCCDNAVLRNYRKRLVASGSRLGNYLSSGNKVSTMDIVVCC